MKNSIKFLTTAGLLLGSLTAYIAALRTEYRLGAFKNPLRNFDALDVPAAGVMGVYVSKDAAKYVHVSQQGTRLAVALSYPEKEEYLGREAAVIVRCPRLSALTAGTTYTLAGRSKTTAHSNGDQPNYNKLLVTGFVQDSLRLVQDHTAHVVLAGNRLGRLWAEVGRTPGSTAQLDLQADNRLAASDLRLEAHSKLLATNLALPALRRHLGDSASVELSGAALRSLR